jgi:hypothetical protein
LQADTNHEAAKRSEGSKARPALKWLRIVAMWILSVGVQSLAVLVLHQDPWNLWTDQIFRSRELFSAANYIGWALIPMAQVATVVALTAEALLESRKGAPSTVGARLSQRTSAFLGSWRFPGSVLGAVVLLHALSGLFRMMLYETNDDPTTADLMRLAPEAMGETGTTFHGIWFLRTIGAMQQAIPVVQWYPLVLVAVQTISLSVLFVWLIRKGTEEFRSSGLGFWAGQIAFSGLCLYMILYLQFTHVSALAAGAGTVLLGDWQDATRSGDSQKNRIYFAIGAVLLAAGLQIRFLGALLGIGVVAAGFAVSWITTRAIQPSIQRLSASWLVLAVPVALFVFDSTQPGGLRQSSWVSNVHPEEACFSEPPDQVWTRIAERDYGPLSPNDSPVSAGHC